MLHSSKYIRENVIRRFSEPDETRLDLPVGVPGATERSRAQHLRRFYRMAEVRKRQILEKMLMD